MKLPFNTIAMQDILLRSMRWNSIRVTYRVQPYKDA